MIQNNCDNNALSLTHNMWIVSWMLSYNYCSYLYVFFMFALIGEDVHKYVFQKQSSDWVQKNVYEPECLFLGQVHSKAIRYPYTGVGVQLRSPNGFILFYACSKRENIWQNSFTIKCSWITVSLNHSPVFQENEHVITPLYRSRASSISL